MSIDAASADPKNPVSHSTENAAYDDPMVVDPTQAGAVVKQRILGVRTVSHADLPDLVALDQRCLGGIWSLEGYSREIDSPNSDLIVLSSPRITIPDPDTDPASGRLSQATCPTCTITRALSDSTASASTSLAPSAPFVALGCLWSILEEAHITLLGVDPAYRRQGLGQFLLYVLLTCAQHRGLERATLEVRVSNQGAIALYEQFGFRRAGCRKHYYSDGEDALILWLNGLHRPEFAQSQQQWWQSIELKLQATGWLVQPDDCLSLKL